MKPAVKNPAILAILILLITSTIQKPISISSFDVIKNEKINYSYPIIISSTTLTEVYHYSREFETYIDYKLLSVKLNIPYTGHDTKERRARIVLYLDDEEIYDGSIYNGPQRWELRPINLEGIGQNIKAGNHKIKLMCCVDGGSLYIPAFGIDFIENTVKPEIFGKMIIIGQN